MIIFKCNCAYARDYTLIPLIHNTKTKCDFTKYIQKSIEIKKKKKKKTLTNAEGWERGMIGSLLAAVVLERLQHAGVVLGAWAGEGLGLCWEMKHKLFCARAQVLTLLHPMNQNFTSWLAFLSHQTLENEIFFFEKYVTSKQTQSYSICGRYGIPKPSLRPLVFILALSQLRWDFLYLW